MRQKGKLEEGEHRGGVKCWNLECIIDAEQQGKDAPSELKMDDLLNEEAGRDREGDNKKAAGEVTFID